LPRQAFALGESQAERFFQSYPAHGGGGKFLRAGNPRLAGNECGDKNQLFHFFLPIP
jgi:hypothetical protein